MNIRETKYIQFALTYDREKQQILSRDKLSSENVWHPVIWLKTN